MRLSLLIAMCLCIISCGGNSGGGGGIDLSGYTTTNLAGNGVRAQKFTTDGTLTEEGYVAHGKMNGVWTTYHPDGKLKTLTTYVDNLKSGPHLEFTNRGQIELKAHFNNGEFDGPYGKYKNGRPLLESNYINGKIDGFYREYYTSGKDAGKLQRQSEYKNGVQDGKLEYFNAEGEVTLTYQFKNGKQVGEPIQN
jgi:antitoxin component YwqK of YwqJK toxin-antitoxin module